MTHSAKPRAVVVFLASLLLCACVTAQGEEAAGVRFERDDGGCLPAAMLKIAGKAIGRLPAKTP
jgi:hypothetical protein